MNNKMMLSLLVASALIGTACQAHPFQMHNAKLGSTFYIFHEKDYGPVSTWQAITPLKPFSTNFTNEFNFHLSTEPRVNDTTVSYQFYGTTPRTPSKTFLLKAFYASPRQGFIVQALEKYQGKKLINNVSQQEVRYAAELLAPPRAEPYAPLAEEEEEFE